MPPRSLSCPNTLHLLGCHAYPRSRKLYPTFLAALADRGWACFEKMKTRPFQLSKSQRVTNTDYTQRVKWGRVMIEGNIWAASLEVYIRNWKWVLGYVCMSIALSLIEMFIKINAGASLFITLLMSTFLAIPAHIAVLTDLNADQVNVWLKQRPKAFFAFVRRCLLLGLLGAIVPIAVAIALLVGGVHASIILPAGICVWIFSGVAAFAKWGTMLPAIIADDDQTLAAPGKRGSKVFGYAFLRLLISFVLVTVLLLAIAMLLLSLPGIDMENAGSWSLTLGAAAAAGGAYQIVMTSVVLSRSYLRAQPTAPSTRRMKFAFGK